MNYNYYGGVPGQYMDTEPPLIFIGDSIYYTQNSIHHLLWTYKLACFPP